MSLIHSLWQAALLVCLYYGAELFIKRNNPAYKRNLLFILLATQFFLAASTFYIYYVGLPLLNSEYIVSNLSELFIRQPLIEKAAPWLMGAYSVVIVFKTVQMAFNWQQCKINSKATWSKPSIDLRVFTAVKANEFGIRRKVSLWYSNAINTPLTFGSLKPVILLPVALVNNLSVAETETLIIHELAHIKSNDYFLNWLLIICETIFFFNPFIKVLSARIRLEREKNCDTQVLQFNYPALDYAETLLRTARFKSAPAAFFLAAAFKNAQLIKRIQFFTEEKNLRFYKRNYNSLALVPLMAVLLLNIFLMDLVKNKKSLSTVIPQKIKIASTASPAENLNNSISTDGMPVSAADYVLSAEANQQLATQKKINAEAEALKLPVNVPEQDQELISDEPTSGTLVMPVSLVQPDESKEIILKEENSATGRSVTKVYKMKLENGAWKATLMWTITERRSATDSLLILKDTSTRFFNQLLAQ